MTGTTYSKPPVVPAWAETGDVSEVGLNLDVEEIKEGWPAGDTPPSRQRMNWVQNYCANAVRYFMQRGLVGWDTDETYQAGAIVIGSDGEAYIGQSADNEENDPVTDDGSNWLPWSPGGRAEVGKISLFDSTVVPYNYLIAIGGTIGDASSNGTQRANADTWWLFLYYWTNYTDETRPIFESDGDPSTRGASAAADFAAHKAITISDLRSKFLRPNDYSAGEDPAREIGSDQAAQSFSHRHVTLMPQDEAGSSGSTYSGSNFGGTVGGETDSGKWRMVNTNVPSENTGNMLDNGDIDADTRFGDQNVPLNYSVTAAIRFK